MMGVPRHMVRLEDLQEKPLGILSDMMRFVLCTPDIAGTRVERHIQLIAEQIEKGQLTSKLPAEPRPDLLTKQ